MPVIAPLQLAQSLTGIEPAALSLEPTRGMLAAIGAEVVFLDRERVCLGGNEAGLRRLAGGDDVPCHVAFRSLPAPCLDCPLTTGRPSESGTVACVAAAREAGGVVCLAVPYVSGRLDARLADILEHAIAAVFVTDRDSRLLYANGAYARLHGRSVAGLVGCPLSSLLSLEDYAKFQTSAREVLQSRQAIERESCVVIAGRQRWFLVALIPLFDLNGEVEALCGMLNDMTARRQAERDLIESQRRYLAIVEDQTELVVRFSPELTRLFANTSLARLMGMTPADLVGGSFLEYQSGSEARDMRCRLEELSSDDPVCDIRQHLSLPGGRERYLSWTIRAIFEPTGILAEYQGTGRDITAYWRMERELLQSEAKYRDIFEHSAEGIFQFDPEGSMVACNPALARILGYHSVADILAERGDLFRRIQARQEDRLEFLRQLAQSGRVLDYEMQVVRYDGRTVWLSLNARAVIGPGKRLMRVEGAARDITDRKRAEDERMLLVAAVDQSAEGLVIVSRDFRLEYANPAFDQIVGPAVGDHGDAAMLAPFLTPAVRKMLGLGLRWSDRVRLVRPDGGEGVVEAIISPVRDSFGRIVNHVMLVRDMTYETGLEKRLRQAEKLEAIGVLAGGVAHDFNNILTPILLNTEMILADIPWRDPLRKPLSDVVRASERARDLVRQLLTFSRQGELTVGPLPLTPLVKETIKLARGMVDTRVTIRQKVSELDLIVEADPAQLHQVLMNLCLNAAQAMPSGGRIEVGLTAVPEPPRPDEGTIAAGLPLAKLAPGPYARLWVADRGHGMPPDICERIFEPFFTTKKPGQGTGMGLAAVHGIIKSCSGAVLVTSTPGKGSRFDIYLPLLPKPDAQSPIS